MSSSILELPSLAGMPVDIAVDVVQHTGELHAHRKHGPLGITASIDLTSEQRQRLQILEDYDLWFVKERLLRKNLVPDDLIDQAIFEFKRYIALATLGYKNLAMADEVVDEVWHAFILFTHEYAEFGNAVAGQFLHHVPRTSVTTDDPRPALDRMLQLYRSYYETEPSWFSMKASADTCCTDCFDCIQCT